MARWLLVLLLLTSAGCTITREFDGDRLSVEQLVALVGATTKVEVLEAVGPPNDVGLRQHGSLFIYRFRFEEDDNLNLSFFQATFDYSEIDRRTQRLTVFFDKQGRKVGQGFDRGGMEEEAQEEEAEEKDADEEGDD